MQNSNKILIVILLLLLLIITGLVISSRIILDNSSYRHTDFSGENTISKTFDYTDFDAIRSEGAWHIIVNRSDSFSVIVEYPDELADKLDVSTQGNELILDNDIRWDHERGNFRATIGMPELTSIDTEEGVSMEIEDFICENLAIKITGAAEIRGNHTRIENLDIRCEGATHVNFRNSETVNAKININGASRIVLNMTGGKLTGSAHGASSIVYYGKVSTQDIETAGAVSVRHR